MVEFMIIIFFVLCWQNIFPLWWDYFQKTLAHRFSPPVVKGTWGTRLDTQPRRFRPPAPEQQSMGGPSFRWWFLGSFGPSAQAGGTSGERLLNASLWESIFLLNRKRRNLPVTVSRKQRAIALPRNLKKGLAEQTGKNPMGLAPKMLMADFHFKRTFSDPLPGYRVLLRPGQPLWFGRSWSLEC